MTGPDDSRRPTSVRAEAVGDADRRAEHPDRRRDRQRPAASRARPSSRHESPRLVVIGGSAGGVEALLRVARTLPPGFPAPIVVVIHIAPTATSRLPEILTRTGPLPAQHVVEGDRLRPGVLSIAPPDRHVVVNDGTLSLIEGPRENGVRPAIDPLFRSAARSYGSGLIAAVLSGTLDDGTAGLAAVHANRGV